MNMRRKPPVEMPSIPRTNIQTGVIKVLDPLPDPLLPITKDNPGPHTIVLTGSTREIEAYSDLCTGVLFYGDKVQVATVAGQKQITTPGRQNLVHVEIVEEAEDTVCSRLTYVIDIFPECDSPTAYRAAAYDPISAIGLTAGTEITVSYDPGQASEGRYAITVPGCPAEEEPTP